MWRIMRGSGRDGLAAGRPGHQARDVCSYRPASTRVAKLARHARSRGRMFYKRSHGRSDLPPRSPPVRLAELLRQGTLPGVPSDLNLAGGTAARRRRPHLRRSRQVPEVQRMRRTASAGVPVLGSLPSRLQEHQPELGGGDRGAAGGVIRIMRKPAPSPSANLDPDTERDTFRCHRSAPSSRSHR